VAASVRRLVHDREVPGALGAELGRFDAQRERDATQQRVVDLGDVTAEQVGQCFPGHPGQVGDLGRGVLAGVHPVRDLERVYEHDSSSPSGVPRSRRRTGTSSRRGLSWHRG
jgi:hypothetical protein